MSSSVLALEHAFIKVIGYRTIAKTLYHDHDTVYEMSPQVPYESLQKNFRSNQKVLEREATALHSQLADLVANARMAYSHGWMVMCNDSFLPKALSSSLLALCCRKRLPHRARCSSGS